MCIHRSNVVPTRNGPVKPTLCLHVCLLLCVFLDQTVFSTRDVHGCPACHDAGNDEVVS